MASYLYLQGHFRFQMSGFQGNKFQHPLYIAGKRLQIDCEPDSQPPADAELADPMSTLKLGVRCLCPLLFPGLSGRMDSCIVETGNMEGSYGKSCPFILVILAILISGCGYIEERARDFGDCFKLSVGAGFGAHVEAQILMAKIGTGYWWGYSIGLNRKSELGIWREEDAGIPLISIISESGPFSEGNVFRSSYAEQCRIISNYEEGNGTYTSAEECLLVLLKSKYIAKERRLWVSWTDAFWIQATASLFVQVRVGFNIAEFIDFVLGWFGIDIAKDDKLSR